MKKKNIGKKSENQNHIRDFSENTRKNLKIYEDAEVKQSISVFSRRVRDDMFIENGMDLMQVI